MEKHQAEISSGHGHPPEMSPLNPVSSSVLLCLSGNSALNTLRESLCKTGKKRWLIPWPRQSLVSRHGKGAPRGWTRRHSIFKGPRQVRCPRDSADIHLGWEQFEGAVDETAYLKAKQQVEGFNKAYGAAIEALRKEKGLRQSDIEGLTPRQVGRIESGQCRATLSALRKLAKAHHMSVNEYLEELSKSL